MATPLIGRATTRPILIQWASATVSTGRNLMTRSRRAAAGRLPDASRSTTGQSTWSATWWRQPPAVLVIEA